MSQETARIKRHQRKTRTDDRGRNVWADTVKTVELELVSTGQLQAILESADDESREAIRKAAASDADGVLARDSSNGSFEIIDDNQLQAILDATDDPAPAVRPAEATLDAVQRTDEDNDLSLVSTQMLRKLLGDEEPAAQEESPLDAGGGFDPYNSG